MKRAILLRHASALEGAHDALRELSAEGHDEAVRAGRSIAALGAPWAPTRALCSDAVRARATLEAVRIALPSLAHVETSERLYLANVGELLAAIQATPDVAACLLVVAHEPGLSSLVHQLVGHADRDAGARFARGMRPASFAALAFHAARWEEALPGGAALAAFESP